MYALDDCVFWDTDSSGSCSGRVWPNEHGKILCEHHHNTE